MSLVIAFDAHVLWWNLDGNPPPERARHHIKEASFYGKDEWEVKMVVKMEVRDLPLSSWERLAYALMILG